MIHKEYCDDCGSKQVLEYWPYCEDCMPKHIEQFDDDWWETEDWAPIETTSSDFPIEDTPISLNIDLLKEYLVDVIHETPENKQELEEILKDTVILGNQIMESMLKEDSRKN